MKYLVSLSAATLGTVGLALSHGNTSSGLVLASVGSAVWFVVAGFELGKTVRKDD